MLFVTCLKILGFFFGYCFFTCVFFLFIIQHIPCYSFFFLKDPAPPEFSPFPLPAPLPISPLGMESTGLARFLFEPASDERLGILDAVAERPLRHAQIARHLRMTVSETTRHLNRLRSEEHTSELQSQSNLVCRLLLEKKKKT